MDLRGQKTQYHAHQDARQGRKRHQPLVQTVQGHLGPSREDKSQQEITIIKNRLLLNHRLLLRLKLHEKIKPIVLSQQHRQRL